MQSNNKKQSIWGHIRELRFRIFISLSFYILMMGLSFAYAKEIYNWLIIPLAALEQPQVPARLIYTGLAEGFFTHLRIACYSAFIISLPFFLWQIYRFITPGLYNNERKIFCFFLILSFALFIIGIIMVYKIILPLVWPFFLSFQSKDTTLPIVLEARISEYLDLILQMMIAFGLAFQIPTIIGLLSVFNCISSTVLIQKRRHAIVMVFIIAAILTPPDVITQITLAIPMLLLYEISILLSKAIEKHRK